MNLNWKADTISEVFGYDTLGELKEAPLDTQTQAILTIMVANQLSEREQYLLAAFLKVVVGIKIESSIDVCKYLVSLDIEDRKDLVQFWSHVINDIDFEDVEED